MSNSPLSSSPTSDPAGALPGSMLEYQQRLSRLSSNQGVSNIQEAFVAVRLGQQNWLVELSEVQEALAPPRMARIASSPAWVAGVVGVRGQVWSVIDMLALSPDSQDSSSLPAARGWMTLLRDPPESQGDRLALLWSDMVEVATKQDYTRLDYKHSEEGQSGQANESGPVVSSLDEIEFLSGDGKLPPWTRALWKDASGQIWRELDTSQIIGPQGLVASWRQRVDVPSHDPTPTPQSK